MAVKISYIGLVNVIMIFVSVTVLCLIISCNKGNPNTEESEDTLDVASSVSVIDSKENIEDLQTYNLDSILKVIHGHERRMPKRLKGVYLRSRIENNEILVFMGDTGKVYKDEFRKNVIDSPIIRFIEEIAVIQHLVIHLSEEESIENNSDNAIEETNIPLTVDTCALEY